MSNTVLILGASGKIGRHTAKAFEFKGWEVRRFNRHNDIMKASAVGADVIVNGMNPQNYHDWKSIIPSITQQVIDAANATGATVLLPGNVYHFGNEPGTWSEKTIVNPVSRKGRIRFDMERAYQSSGVQTIVLRAGNFIDPDCQGCVMSEIYMRNITKNKVILPGPPDKRQSMCYVPDWARAATSLAEMRNKLSQFEDIPFPGHTITAHDLKSRLERLTETELKFSKFPWWLFNLASPFWELAREMNEMRYLWNTDHALCGKRFQELLPNFVETDFDTVLKVVLDGFRKKN